MARFYLLLSAVGLFPVALSYGIVPDKALPKIMEVTVEGRDLTHVFRAIMGLYLGMIVLWILGAMRPGLARAAVISEIVFMAGLAVGRIISIVVDGVPSIALIGYTGVEIVIAVWGLFVLKKCSLAPSEKVAAPA